VVTGWDDSIGAAESARPDGEDFVSASGEDRTSTFERHCGLLLRAYPAAYRSERGEEIIGTLLETTPEDRAWPLPRDIRSLVTGGLSARGALNRRNTTAANLRVAVLVGVAAYLAYVAARDLGALLSTVEVGFRRGHPLPFSWSLLVVATLIIVTLVLAWLSRRRAVVLAGALPAVAAVAVVGPWFPSGLGSSATQLACLAVLIAVAGRERPDRRWLWLIGPVVLAALLTARVLPDTSLEKAAVLALCLQLSLVVVTIAWLAIDARPVIAIVVFFLATWLSAAMYFLALGSAGFPAELPYLGIWTAVTAAAFWRLRRQSAHPGGPSVS
jgi:hypothetical protein